MALNHYTLGLLISVFGTYYVCIEHLVTHLINIAQMMVIKNRIHIACLHV